MSSHTTINMKQIPLRLERTRTVIWITPNQLKIEAREKRRVKSVRLRPIRQQRRREIVWVEKKRWLAFRSQTFQKPNQNLGKKPVLGLNSGSTGHLENPACCTSKRGSERARFSQTQYLTDWLTTLFSEFKWVFSSYPLTTDHNNFEVQLQN